MESQKTATVFAAAAAGNAPRIVVDTIPNTLLRQAQCGNNVAWRVVRTVPDQNHLVCMARRYAVGIARSGDFKVTKHDLHQQIRSGKSANLILFVVDLPFHAADTTGMEKLKAQY